MSEESRSQILKHVFSSLEMANEKQTDFAYSSFNQQTTNNAELETNIITIIKELERTSSNNYLDPRSSLLDGKNHFLLFNEKEKVLKMGFVYVILFLFISFIHVFNLLNIFDLFVSKDFKGYCCYSPLNFGIFGILLNIFWFLANILSIIALLKKSRNCIIYSIISLFAAFLFFLIDIVLYIYVVENKFIHNLGLKELIFLIFEGVLIVIFLFGANYFRMKIERIKFLKTLDLEASN